MKKDKRWVGRKSTQNKPSRRRAVKRDRWPKKKRQPTKPIRNWSAYNEGLVRRYDITLWIDEAIFAKPERTGKRGRPQEYSDALIELGAKIKATHTLPYRGTEGMLRGLFKQMGRTENVPDFSTLNRRIEDLVVEISATQSGEPMHLVADTTGVKIFGEGEWKVRMHGWSKRRTWRKLHLLVDEATQDIVVCDLTENNVGDQEHLPVLLAALPKEIKVCQVSADGIYDTYECYDETEKIGAKLVTPPRKNAVIKRGDPPHPRHDAIRRCRKKGRKKWKKESGYHRRSLSETAMFRYKVTFGPGLYSRTLNRQKVEARINVKTLNEFRKLAAPAY